MKGILMAASIAAIAGCASTVSDSDYPVSVASYPAGANFEVRNEKGFVVSNGVTPGQIMLKAGAGYFDGETYTITYRKEGHADQTTVLDSEIDGWYWGNIIFGGLIGMLIVDPSSGAMYKLPSHVSASLAPAPQPVAALAVEAPSKSKAQLLEELASDASISYDEYRRRHDIIMRAE